MKRALKVLIPIILILALLIAGVWFFFGFRTDLTADALMERANKLVEKQRYSRAIHYYSQAIRLEPERTDLPIALADTYILTDNYTKAEYTLVQAISASPSALELYNSLCKAYVAQDKLLDAVQMLDRIADEGVKAQLDTLRPAAPEVLPESGYYTEYVTVSVNSQLPTVYLSTDGGYPSASRDLYEEPVQLGGGETTVTAIAVDPETGLVSPMVRNGYTVGGVVEETTLSDPAIDAAARELLGLTAEDVLMTDDLWALTDLTLEKPADISDLKKFTGLRSLTIHNVSSLDFTVLASMPSLEYLDLTGCTISSNSLLTIGSLVKLRTLLLGGCALTDIDPLAPLTALTKLDLSNNNIENIGILSLLLELQEVNLSNNPLASIAGLSTCSHLTVLNVSNCELSSLSSLTGKTELTELIAANNKLVTLDDLEGCTALSRLDAGANLLTNISVLPKLPELTVFNGNHNQIEAVPDFDESSCKLQQFSINYNQVSALNGLVDLPDLNYINVDYNKVTDLTILALNPNLVQVNAWDNPISEESVAALKAESIILNYNPNFKAE